MSDEQRIEYVLEKNLNQASKTFLANSIATAGQLISKLREEQAALTNALPQTVERNSIPVVLKYGDEVIPLPDDLLVRAISKRIPDLIRNELNCIAQQIEQATLRLAAIVVKEYQDKQH